MRNLIAAIQAGRAKQKLMSQKARLQVALALLPFLGEVGAETARDIIKQGERVERCLNVQIKKGSLFPAEQTWFTLLRSEVRKLRRAFNNKPQQLGFPIEGKFIRIPRQVQC